MSNIKKNYLRILEVISSFNCDSHFRSNVGIKFKTTDIELVALN